MGQGLGDDAVSFLQAAMTRCAIIAAMLILPGTLARGQELRIEIDARQPGRPVSRYLTGACIEDVNHEIYGGIYSQMIFGESFQEPPRSTAAGGDWEPVKGFIAVDGKWSVRDGEVLGGDGPGPKLLSTAPAFAAGEASVEVYFPTMAAGNGGLIVKTANATAGIDAFDGYEVSIDVARKVATLSRHHHDWKLLKEAPCDVSPGRWITLSTKMTAQTFEISVDGNRVIQFEDFDTPVRSGTVALRDWQRPVRYRHLWVNPGHAKVDLPFEPGKGRELSGMWSGAPRGTAALQAELITDQPFTGTQSQRLTFASGDGEAAIANRGLNRWGMSFVSGKAYDGYLWVRADSPADLFVALESKDGSRRYATTQLLLAKSDWRRIDFTLTPVETDPAGRFLVGLSAPGSVVIGHAFLEPGEWGRFKGLPVRRDVAEGLVDQGITVLRYGGSMVNAPEYRWKKMIGPRDRRPPYKGTWYPYSTNGWGIIDFLELCESANFLGVPDLNMDETPQDMSDFVEYVNGPVDSKWGRRERRRPPGALRPPLYRTGKRGAG